MNKLVVYLLVIANLLCMSEAEAKLLRVIGPQSEVDVAFDYFNIVLGEALNASVPNKYQLLAVNAEEVSQGRALHLLEKGFLDVYWTGTSIHREEQFRAVPVPLLKGLLGYRIFILRGQESEEFATITESQLKKKVACQGEHWPDTKILEHNGFSVAPVALYRNMFEMVSMGRCDYFPRSVFEAYGELSVAKENSPNLTVSDAVLLHYPFPIYFFVNHGDEALARDIHAGLTMLINNGRLDELLQQHPLVQHLYPLEKWKSKTIIKLDNPFLPESSHIPNTHFWLGFK